MNPKKSILHGAAVTLILTLSFFGLGFARQQNPAPPVPSKLEPVDLPAPIVTLHEGTFNGRRVRFEAVVEPIIVADAKGNPAARLVTTSYIAREVDSAPRPVLFVFNGGPIGPSIPLHIGAFGPKRIAVPEDTKADLSDLKFVDNIYTPLDAADVVIFDPANTGYSRTLEGVAPETYFSNVADGQQLAQLVIEWSKIHGRASSPKYLVGESYGTMRAVETAEQLQKTETPLSGIMLLGQAVNIIEYCQRPRNIVSYAVSLPTLAAVAWSHDRADRKGRDFDAFIRDARDYGAGEYLSVLFLGDTAPLARRETVALKLQEFTGLSAAEYIGRNLKIRKVEYLRMLFPGRILNSYDARYFEPDKSAENRAGYLNIYGSHFIEYLNNELKAGGLGVYSDVNPVGGSLAGWDWGPNKTPFGDWPYTDQVSRVLKENPTFRVFVANGYQDTETTIGAMDYLVFQSGWPRERVRTAYYWGGHMFYTVEESLKKLMDDVRAMVTGAW